MKNKSLKQYLSEISDIRTRIHRKGLLSLNIKNCQETIFEGEVKTITSYNQYGIFDVLPQHSNFITIIQKSIIIIDSNSNKKSFEVKRGIFKVWDNKANVFLDTLAMMEIYDFNFKL